MQEARALLGRLEYQRGNFDAALQVFQGIDIRTLSSRMSKAISERTRPLKPRSKGDILPAGVMSLHSVSLLLEEILLKAKSLEELSRIKGKAASRYVIWYFSLMLFGCTMLSIQSYRRLKMYCQS